VVQGGQGAPSQPGNRVSNPSDCQGGHVEHPDLLPAICSPAPCCLLCLPTVTCPWRIALPFSGGGADTPNFRSAEEDEDGSSSFAVVG